MNLFTVEQLELCRRLRSTGMSVEAILEAFRSLDAIETKLRLPAAQPPEREKSVELRAEMKPALEQPAAAVQRPLPMGAFTTVPESCVFGTPTAAPHFAPTAAVRPAPRPLRGNNRGPAREAIVLEDPQELEEFMQQGEEACIQEMKKFITHYSLRQTTVAQMTAVSQPYISKLLNGNHRELSLRCRRNIYAWYLQCKKNPSIYCQDPSTRLETNGDGELVPQRRERYVFRPSLIRLLEAFFVESPFPDGQRRAEIAQALNHTLQMEKHGQHLLGKEIVTPQVVSNWFANKRKEQRRKSNEENRAKNAAMGAPLSDSTATPSPSNSMLAESPTAVLLPPPLSFAHPLALFVQQQQQQRLIPQPPLPTARPFLPFQPLGGLQPLPSLSELLSMNRSAQMAAVGSEPSPPLVPHHLSPMGAAQLTPVSLTPTTAGSGSFEEEQPALMSSEEQNSVQVDAYRELFESMLGGAFFQQHLIANAVPQNVE
ncbi:hypothetical protein M3Y99_01860800 [Aphelenchoides fujianensis]|nr:hypothetical protein M3Y99_01860800 [Aphelenchoides fujianensis]